MAPAPTATTLGGEGTTSHRLATTVAGNGAHEGAFKAMVGNKAGVAKNAARYVLAPDVTAEAFEAFIDDAKKAVGADNVHVNLSASIEDHERGDYLHQPRFHDFFPIDELDKYMASAAIQPASVEEVQAIVRAANKHGQPLVSRGRNPTCLQESAS